MVLTAKLGTDIKPAGSGHASSEYANIHANAYMGCSYKVGAILEHEGNYTCMYNMACYMYNI